MLELCFERLQKTKNVIEEKTVDVFDKDDIQVQQFNEEEKKDPKLEEQEKLRKKFLESVEDLKKEPKRLVYKKRN